MTNDKSPEVSENKKLIAGTNDSNVGQNYPEYQQYKISLPDSKGNTKDANCYTGGDSTIPGLLKKIDDNGNVIFNYAEPGFLWIAIIAFNSEEVSSVEVKRDF